VPENAFPRNGGCTRRIGLFGGSFDPIHEGHLRAAEDALRSLALERVLLVPAGSQPLKGAHAGPEHRLAMVRLAVEERDGLEASDVEVRRGGKSYTVDTVRELAARLSMVKSPAAAEPSSPKSETFGRQLLPGRRGRGGPRGDVELYLIIGTDAVRDLPDWRDVEGIFRRARPAVLERPGEEPVDWDALARKLPGRLALNLREELRASVVRLERPVDVSSTEIRRRLAAGESIEGLVPSAVEGYIREHGLYRK